MIAVLRDEMLIEAFGGDLILLEVDRIRRRSDKA